MKLELPLVTEIIELQDGSMKIHQKWSFHKRILKDFDDSGAKNIEPSCNSIIFGYWELQLHIRKARGLSILQTICKTFDASPPQSPADFSKRRGQNF